MSPSDVDYFGYMTQICAVDSQHFHTLGLVSKNLVCKKDLLHTVKVALHTNVENGLWSAYASTVNTLFLALAKYPKNLPKNDL